MASRMHSRVLLPLALLLIVPIACGEPEPSGPDDPLCDEWNDEAPVNDVTVRIRNDTANPIYLGSGQQTCESWIDVFLSDADGNAVSFRNSICGGTCEDLREGLVACPAICAIASFSST